MSSTVVHNDSSAESAASEAVRTEFFALVSGCGVFDLSERVKLSVTGGDRARWLNGMVTNNIRDLAKDHGVYAFLLNPHGHILGDLYAFNRGDSFLVDTDQSQIEKLAATFQRYIIMDDVEVANLGEGLASIGIAGPKTPSLLSAAGVELPQLEPLQTVDVTWQGQSLILVRTDNPGVESYEVWLSPTAATALSDALTEAGAQPVGKDAVNLLRIACGIPLYGTDIRERDLPQETEQHRALHFSKGCYIGQEIVERIRSRGNVHRKFTGFSVQGPLPEPGAKVQADGKDVGEITSVVLLPGIAADHPVALGYIRRELAAAGREVQAGTSRLVVAALPFKDYLNVQTSKD